MSSVLSRAAILVVALAVPVTAHAQLGRLGKKLGKAIGEEVAGKPAAKTNSSSPVLTAEMLDQYLKGIEVEARPRMAAMAKYASDSVAYHKWHRQLDSLNQLLTAEYQRGQAGAAQCQQYLADAGATAAQTKLVERMENMSDDERDKLEARMDAWAEKVKAAQASGDMAALTAYSDSLRNILGADLTSAASASSVAYAECVAKHQQGAGMDGDRIAALNTEMQRLSQKAPREPDRSDLDIPQHQRDSLRVLGIKASGLSESEYAWMQEQTWAYLAHIRRNDGEKVDSDWLEIMKAREADLLKYEFVITGN